jgi:hypothetical protein
MRLLLLLFLCSAVHATAMLANVTVPKMAKPSAVILVQDSAVKNGKFYKFPVDLRMKVEGEVELMLKQRKASWRCNGGRQVTPREKWQRVEFYFQGSSPFKAANSAVLRIDLGPLKGTVQIRNCAMVERDDAVDVGKWVGKQSPPALSE